MQTSEWLRMGPVSQRVLTLDGAMGRAVEVLAVPGREEPLLRVRRLFGEDVYLPLSLVHQVGSEMILLHGTRRDVERAAIRLRSGSQV